MERGGLINVHRIGQYPNSLGNEAVLLGQTHDAVVGLAHATDLTADGVGLGTVGLATGLGVHIHDAQLHGGVVLGVDDPVGCRAAREGYRWVSNPATEMRGEHVFHLPLAGHVQINILTGVVLHFIGL